MLDYSTNDQLEDEMEPLSHASLLRNYIKDKDNWRRLLGLVEPSAPAQPEGALGLLDGRTCT